MLDFVFQIRFVNRQYHMEISFYGKGLALVLFVLSMGLSKASWISMKSGFCHIVKFVSCIEQISR